MRCCDVRCVWLQDKDSRAPAADKSKSAFIEDHDLLKLDAEQVRGSAAASRLFVPLLAAVSVAGLDQ